jgi:probable selenium-dependent hydroxylase accessory protein YqeC
MYALAKRMVSKGKRVVTTTTTKIFSPEPDQSPSLLFLKDDPNLDNLEENLAQFGQVTLGRALLSNGKLDGVSDAIIETCVDLADHVIVEADGAAGRPIKAPEEWEPVVPKFADLVIAVVGLDCVGKPADTRWVFRLERFLEITELANSQVVTPESIARLLGHPLGAFKGAPEKAVLVPFLNKEDLLEIQWNMDEVTNTIFSVVGERINRIVGGSLEGGVNVRSYVRGG